MNPTEVFLREAISNEFNQLEIEKTRNFVIYEDTNINLKQTLHAITSNWIRKYHGEEWSILQLDNISFLDATTAKSRTHVQHSRLGIATNQNDLCGYKEQIKQAKNTLSILIWDWQSDEGTIRLLRHATDVSVTVVTASDTLTRPIDWTHRVITPAV